MPRSEGDTGIQYGYGDPNGAQYHLGEKPVSAFLLQVYDHLNDLPDGAVVVDLGCGAGRFPAHAPVDRQWRTFGVDHDPAAIEQARKVAQPKDTLVVADITQLDKLGLNGEVAAAVSHRVLHALPDELQEPVLRSAASILPAEGDLFISAAAATDWKADALRERGQFEPGKTIDVADIMFRDRGVRREQPFAMSFFTSDSLVGLADRTGLEVVSLGSFTEASGYDHLANVENTYVAAQLRKKRNGNGGSSRREVFTSPPKTAGPARTRR